MRLGIDLGGTNLAYGVVDRTGQVVVRDQHALPNYLFGDVVTLMIKIYQQYATQYDIIQVGIGVPGIVADGIGDDVSCVNLAWQNQKLHSALSKHIKCPISIGNDANAACIAETLFGNMKGHQNTALLTLGTGVGSGFIIGGKMVTSQRGGAEFGHVIIAENGYRCNCGNIGCLETFTSATAIIRHYNDLDGVSTVGNAAQVFDRYQRGDDRAFETVNWFCEHLAVGIINLYNFFAPEVVCLAGGVSRAFPLFEDTLKEAVNRRVFNRAIQYGKIVQSALDDAAGIIGAAYLSEFN